MGIVAFHIIIKKEVVMPGGNKTGPDGRGSMTGRGMGYCNDNEHPGSFYSNSNRSIGFGRGGGRGNGRGFGMGRGDGFQYRNGMEFRYGNRNFSGSSMEDVSEKALLENEIRILKDQLSTLDEKLTKLD